MAIDYNDIAATAKSLIEDEFAGSAVTLVALDYDVEDASKPWRGPVDPRATPGKTLSVKVLFLPIAGNIKLGLSKEAQDLIKRADATALVGSQEDLRVYHELIVDRSGERFKITHVEELMPGDVRILSYLVLNQ